MSDMSGGTDPLKEAIDRIKRDAYGAGWAAAVEAITSAIVAMPVPDGTEPGSFTFSAKPSVPGGTGNTNSGSQPTVGTTPWFVLQAVQKKQGMSGADVIAAVRAEGHDVGEAQIRTALSRLEKRQLLANRHRKWFLK